MKMTSLPRALCVLIALSVALPACTPTVKLEAPDKPIEINMNVNIQQDVRVRVDRDVNQAIAANPDLFGMK